MFVRCRSTIYLALPQLDITTNPQNFKIVTINTLNPSLRILVHLQSALLHLHQKLKTPQEKQSLYKSN